MPRTDRRGHFLILWGLTFSFMFLTFIVGYFPFFQTTLRTTNRGHLATSALALADAGIERALWQYNFLDPTFSGWTQLTQAQCDALEAGHTACRRLTVPLTAGDTFGGSLGDFETVVFDPASTTPVLRSTGYLGGQASPVFTRTVRVQLDAPPRPYSYAAFGADRFRSIMGGGTAVQVSFDGYDSLAGPYDPLLNRFPTKLGSNGDLDPATTDVTMTTYFANGGGAFSTSLYGDIWVPPTAQVSAGTMSVNYQDPELLPPVEIPPELVALEPTCNGMLDADGTTVTLGPGDHCYSHMWAQNGGRVILEPGARVYLNASVNPSYSALAAMGGYIEAQGNNKIYINGGMISLYGNYGAGGAIVTNAEPKPQDLQIFQKGWSSLNFISQRSPFYGTIYSEDGTLEVVNYYTSSYWNVELFGSLISRNGEVLFLTGGGSVSPTKTVKLHYDRALERLDLQGNPWRVRVVSWNALD